MCVISSMCNVQPFYLILIFFLTRQFYFRILIVQDKNIFFLQFFVRLEHIRKCFTMKEGVFVLEEYSKSEF